MIFEYIFTFWIFSDTYSVLGSDQVGYRFFEYINLGSIWLFTLGPIGFRTLIFWSVLDRFFGSGYFAQP